MRASSTVRLSAALAAGAAAVATTGAAQASPQTGAPERLAAATCSTVPRPTAYKAYADAVMAAWAKGNQPLARCYTYGYVADFLFAQNPKGTGWTYVGTRVLDGMARVNYRQASGATLQLSILDPKRMGTRPAVHASAMNGAAQGRVTTYADELIRAWGRGDKTAMLRYGTPKVVDYLWTFSGGPGAKCWMRTTTLTGLEPAGPSISYTCESATMTLVVKPWGAANGARQSVVGAHGVGAG